MLGYFGPKIENIQDKSLENRKKKKLPKIFQQFSILKLFSYDTLVSRWKTAE